MIESILKRFHEGQELDKGDLCSLLSIPVGSGEYYSLLAAANGYSRKAFDGKGLIFGQIGLDVQPCPVNCRFCSLAADVLNGHAPIIRDMEQTVQLGETVSGRGSGRYLFDDNGRIPKRSFFGIWQRGTEHPSFPRSVSGQCG